MLEDTPTAPMPDEPDEVTRKATSAAKQMVAVTGLAAAGVLGVGANAAAYADTAPLQPAASSPSTPSPEAASSSSDAEATPLPTPTSTALPNAGLAPAVHIVKSPTSENTPSDNNSAQLGQATHIVKAPHPSESNSQVAPAVHIVKSPTPTSTPSESNSPQLGPPTHLVKSPTPGESNSEAPATTEQPELPHTGDPINPLIAAEIAGGIGAAGGATIALARRNRRPEEQ